MSLLVGDEEREKILKMFPKDDYKAFTSKYLIEEGRVIIFKECHILEQLKYDLGKPEGFLNFLNIERIRALMEDIKKSDGSYIVEQELKKIEKDIDVFVLTKIGVKS